MDTNIPLAFLLRIPCANGAGHAYEIGTQEGVI